MLSVDLNGIKCLTTFIQTKNRLFRSAYVQIHQLHVTEKMLRSFPNISEMNLFGIADTYLHSLSMEISTINETAQIFVHPPPKKEVGRV